MPRSFPFEEGGSATGVLITEKGHVPGCDSRSVRRKIPRRQSFPTVELGYLAGTLPQFNIMAVNKQLCLFHGLIVISALKFERRPEVPI
jgi:hypothetical protein